MGLMKMFFDDLPLFPKKEANMKTLTSKAKITTAFLALMFCVSGIVLPSEAKADSFSLTISDRGDRDDRSYHRGGRHHGRHDDDHRGRGRGRGRHHDHHWYRSSYDYYWPSYHYTRPRTVVVQRPVVYYQPTPIVAEPVTNSYYARNGQLCREYQTSGWVGGSMQEAYGTACLQPDGSWRVVD